MLEKNYLWPRTTAEAVALQKELRHKVRIKDEGRAIRLIAGIDVGYDPALNISRCAIVLMEAQTLELSFSNIVEQPTPFPYVPGLLSFREAPIILDTLKTLPRQPDLLMIDGHGIAHPRRLGIASHVGVLANMPAVGVAKKRLAGVYKEPGPNKGDTSALMDKGEKIGTVLRSKTNVKPLFISPGHRISHEKALEIVMACLRKHRLPEPTRLADRLSKKESGPARKDGKGRTLIL